ncbi:hypothetical protein ACRN9A_16670 [Shewanella frigidimarina]|uniref:hypothetical protein n=1 Tax=Shewanella frigidimarina TaxID=56812 RepID=UPI003D79F1D4
MIWKIPFDLDADKDLSDLAWFKLIVGVGITSIVLSIGLIFLNNSISYGMTYEHFNGVFEVFKFPLQMLIGMTASIALLAALHKSEQTRKQIYLANVQNNFVNYYKHLEEFKKYVDHLDQKQITSGNSLDNYKNSYRQLHSLFYKNSADGDYNCCVTLMDDRILVTLSEISEILISITHSGVKPNDNVGVLNLRRQVQTILINFCSVGNYLMLPNDLGGMIRFDESDGCALSMRNSSIMIDSMITILFHINFVASFDRKHKSFISSHIDMNIEDRARLLQRLVLGRGSHHYILKLIYALLEYNKFISSSPLNLE